jgi:hypothetical protein
MRIQELDENLASQLIKGATKLAPNLSKSAAPATIKSGAQAGQQFLFSQFKDEIVSGINTALKSGQSPTLKNSIYKVLRRGNTVDNINALNYTAAEKAAYKSALDAWPKNNGAWAQKDFGPARTASQASGRTENYYTTLTKDRANLDNFMKSFPDLDSRLAKLSQQTGQPISYKTNSTISALAGDNDNIKFFYYDPKLKPQIEATVQQWLQANRIATGARTHAHGVDIKGVGSYGEIVSKHVDDALQNLIKQHGTKYTPEQYYQWLGNNFKTLIGQVSVK